VLKEVCSAGCSVARQIARRQAESACGEEEMLRR